MDDIGSIPDDGPIRAGAPSEQHADGFAQARAGSALALLRKIEGIGLLRFSIIVCCVYLLIGIAAYFPSWPLSSSRMPGSYIGGDPIQQSWFLEWVPWAILHGHNPFFTTRMYYPSGANLAINTEMPLLGLLSAPLSFLVSPVASFNALLYLSYPLSATAMYAVLRRWTGSNVGSSVGGLVYGFSAYVVGEGLGHLNLSFVPLPPLIFFALFRLFIEQSGSARRWGLTVGLLAAAQFLVSPEVLSTTAIMSGCALVLLGATHYREVSRQRIDYLIRGSLPALAVFLLITIYPIYMMLDGPERFQGAVQGLTNPYRADLFGPFVPTSAQRVTWSSLGDRFAGGPAENGSYLGIPLVVLVLWMTVHFRAKRWILCTVLLALIGFIWSLGPYLVIDTHLTSIPLPFDIVGRLPLLKSILPSRFSLYEVLFVALAVGLGAAEAVRAPASSLAREDTAPLPSPLRPVFGTMFVLLVVAAIVSLVPRWPDETAAVSDALPSYFTSSAVDQIPYNGVVLTYPFSVSPGNWSMLWQETDRLRFTIVGGYALEPQPNGSASPWPPQLQPLDVQEFLGFEALGPYPGYLASSPIPVTGRLIRDMRTYAGSYDIGTVIFDPNLYYQPTSARTVLTVFTRAFGPPSATEGGVDLWFKIQQLAAVQRAG